MDDTGFLDDSIAVYLSEMGAIPPLSEEEESQLAGHVVAKDDQADLASVRLIEANLTMVVVVAHSTRRRLSKSWT
jgi:DNA-directed RNA polymerase sigma subunit (sigma70/sigma32)